MSRPDNKYCPECIFFEGLEWKDTVAYREKHGHTGCSGIPHATGEFPYDYPPHCFRDTPLPTIDDDYSI